MADELRAAIERMIRVGLLYGHTQDAAEALREAWEAEWTRAVIAERFAGIVKVTEHP